MKTFDQAFDHVLFHPESTDEDIKTFAAESLSNKDFCQWVWFGVDHIQSLDAERDGPQRRSQIGHALLRAFAVGVKIGIEMEKAE